MPKKCHFIGIGGIGMSGLAKLMLSQKWEVTGSDISPSYITESLVKAGAQVFIGHDAQHISPEAWVIYSTDIKKDNPEFQAAQQLKCPLLHRSELLFHLMEKFHVLAVAGTHGKTTTSALLATVLLEAGKNPSYAVGGFIPHLGSNAGYGQGEFFVAEADESDGTFLNYHPFGAIITNIDTDHMSYFGTEERLHHSFQQFMSQVKTKEYLFWCKESPRLQQLSPSGSSYGLGADCDLRATNISQSGWKTVFDIVFENRLYPDVEIALVGKHNVLNALAVFGLALRLGIPEASLRKSFRHFGGVLRRCEKKAESHGLLFIDDYAHHPTEIQTTLKGIRQAIGEKRLIVVFQPHRYTRVRDCLGTFHTVFEEADKVIITDIYAGGETPLPDITPHRIIEEVENPCQYIAREQLTEHLLSLLRPHDVVVSLGAGDITRLTAEMVPLLQEKGVKKYKVGIVSGGRSSEHEISRLSAQYIHASLCQDYYEVSSFIIDKKGRWQNEEGENESCLLAPTVMQKLEECDLLFPVLHGPFGEDGTIQGFFEMINKPYVGCDYRSSAIAMDKVLTKELALYHGIATSPFVSCSAGEWKNHKESILNLIAQKLQYPLFVKPVHLGSSIGVTKVENFTQLEDALQQVFLFDSKIVIENGIEGREIEFAILGNEHIKVFPPGEIHSQGELYDYQSKYGAQGMQTFVEADLAPQVVQEGMELAKKMFHVMGGSGLSRIDFFLDKKGKFWLNEVNPIPGFTAISLYPQICAKHGISAKALMDQLIILGLQRKRFCQKYEMPL